MEDCVELEQDIRMYLSLERSPINIEFWEVSPEPAGVLVSSHSGNDGRMSTPS
jgi:hypothetical protein